MSRPITVKHMEQHIECVCGHNEVIPDEWKMTEAYCRKLGYRKKRDARDGHYFWFRYVKVKTCTCADRDGYNHIATDTYDMENPIPAQDPAPVKNVMTDLF